MSSPSPQILNDPAPVCTECLAKDAQYEAFITAEGFAAGQREGFLAARVDLLEQLVKADGKEAEYRLSIVNEKLELTTEKLDLTESLNEKLKDRISMLSNSKVVERLEDEIYRLRERLAEADRMVQALPRKKEHHERKEENDRLKKEVKALHKQKKAFDEAAMPSKKKLQEKVQRLEAELREAKQLNKTILSEMKDTKAHANEVKKHLDGSERCRENEVRELREELKEREKENSKLWTDLGSMELLAGRLEKENVAMKHHLKAQVPKAEDLAKQLADAEEFVALARYPLECYAKIRRRLFNGRRGDFWINEEGNRKAHDGDLVADVSLCKLDQMSSQDITMMGRAYGHEFREDINSSEDLHRLRGRGFSLELINLRASMNLEDPQTCLESILEEFNKLDSECKKIWQTLLEENLTDQERCEKFDNRQDVQGLIIELREIRKRAGGRAGRRVAYEEQSIDSCDSAS